MIAITSPVGFAVIDVETTGLAASGADRVIEVAVVRVSLDGTLLDEWSSLLQVNRDVGPTSIHGIRAGDLHGAPRFDEVAGDLVDLLDGRILVAHNAAFDARFLASEFARVGVDLKGASWLDTMRLAERMGYGRRLAEVAETLGHPVETLHHALVDARLSAQILSAALSRATIIPATQDFPAPRAASAPSDLGRGAALKQRSDTPALVTFTRTLDTVITGLADETPVAPHQPGAEDAFLAALDRVLEDRIILEEEAASLLELARELGLEQEEIRSLAARYLEAEIRRVVASGARGAAIRTDIERLAALLDVQLEHIQLTVSVGTVVTVPATSSASIPVETARDELPDHRDDHVDRLPAGTRVCFTGELQALLDGTIITRERAHELAAHHGLIIEETVTKRLDVLVCADPDSMSGKQRKAQAYGTRIIVEPVFWRLLDVEVEWLL